MELKFLSQCSDFYYLKENLSQESLEYIEKGLQLYNDNEIELIIPRDEKGEIIDFADIDVVDKNGQHSEYAIVVKWYEDFEDTGYLIECCSD